MVYVIGINVRIEDDLTERKSGVRIPSSPSCLALYILGTKLADLNRYLFSCGAKSHGGWGPALSCMGVTGLIIGGPGIGGNS